MQDSRSATSSSELPTLAASQPPNTVSRNRLSTQSYLRRVANILSNMDVVAPQRVHLELITKAAFDAQVVFFTAAMFHPDSADLDHFFDEFVRLCARPALAP
jgi:hypothetical protein